VTTKKKSIRDTLKSERARVAYDELKEDLSRRVATNKEKHAQARGLSWFEFRAMDLELQKFELEQIRQVVITATMIDLEELKLLASTSVAVAALNK